MTESKEIEIKSITIPEIYIRKEVNESHLELLSNSIIHKGKDWPFPPILLNKLKTPRPNGAIYEIVDGVHRFTLAGLHKYKTIPSHVVEYSEKELICAQFRENIHHGLLLTQAERNKWIKMLYNKGGMKCKEIAEAVNLTEASISRILADLQATKDKKKPPKQSSKKENTKKDKVKSVSIFDTFISGCENLHTYILSHKKYLSEKWPDHIDSLQEDLDNFLEGNKNGSKDNND